MSVLPDHSPLLAPDYVCSTCGEVMKRKIIKGPREVSHIEYSCRNKTTGCNYRVEVKIPCGQQVFMNPEGA